MDYLEIEKVIGREIIDSRGNPTVEAEVYLADGTVGRGAAPSGASTGEFEALELRDRDKSRFGGKGVSKAIENINTVISDALAGMDASDIYASGCSHAQGRWNKGQVQTGRKCHSCGIYCVQHERHAISLDIPLYQISLEGCHGNRLPVPMMNILNGGCTCTCVIPLMFRNS